MTGTVAIVTDDGSKLLALPHHDYTERMMNLSTSHEEASPKDLDQLARDVLKQFGIVPENITVVQSGSIKTVWKIRSGVRILCLKRLRQTLDKAQFSVHAQIFIKNAGGLVPGVILDHTGQPIVQIGDQLFVLYEWVNGSDLHFSDPADLKRAVQGLARFHLASRGYAAPEGDARVSTKLGKWPEQYESMKNRLLTWKAVAAAPANLTQPHFAAYAKCCDPMVRLADIALERLARSGYTRLTAPGSSAIVLCHQDFGKGNALASGKDIYVLDLDGVTYDLPARDLRKIIGKIAENKGQWLASDTTSILNWYSEVNPQSAEDREVLYDDLLFPHWFHGLVKNLFLNGKVLKASEIERMARLEESKLPVIKSMLQ